MSRSEKKEILMKEEKDRFDAMRDIQSNAKTFKKWYALCLSVTAFGILWCMGALVFWRVEQQTQDLSYFKALYFCYVSLLTIGYVRFESTQQCRETIFCGLVIDSSPRHDNPHQRTWVTPSSQSSSVVHSNWATGPSFLRQVFGVISSCDTPWLYNWMRKRAEKKRVKAGFPDGPSDGDAPTGYPLTIKQLASEELTQAELTSRLAFAIRKTADDLQHAPGKRYSYEDWCEFTRLIRFTKVGLDQLEYDEEIDGVVEWDWLEENSPMLSQQSESEWILDRLCESLLRLLKKNMPDTASPLDSAQPPSISNTLSAFSFDRRGRTDDDPSTDQNLNKPANSKGKDVTPEPAPESEPEAVPVPAPVIETQERQRRTSGADKVLNFITGDRKGTNAYASSGPRWSRKGQARMKTERRRSSGGRKRVGPFRALMHHGKSAAVETGTGGANNLTLKMRHFTGDGKAKRFPSREL